MRWSCQYGISVIMPRWRIVHTIDGTLPAIGEYRIAARHDTQYLSIIYEKPYQPAEFNFVSEEWTLGTFAMLSVSAQTISRKSWSFHYEVSGFVTQTNVIRENH